MRIVFTPAAETDLSAALDWYDDQAPGIGRRFIAELDALLRRLADNPQQFPAIEGNIRRAGFRHFPYGLFFQLQSDTVAIIACFHASRDPRTWQARS